MEKYNFSQLQQLIRYLFKLRKKRLACFCLNDEHEDKLVQCMESALSLLNKEHREIIENEFMNNSAKYWWQDYFSKTTFYRIKYESMVEFLELLYR